MQNFVTLRCYADVQEKICYTFQPVAGSHATDWDPSWEEWHSYPAPLRIYLTDFEKLLSAYVQGMFPARDAVSHEILPDFDPCFDNWLTAGDFTGMMQRIQKNLHTFSPEEQKFYQAFLQWMQEALEQTTMIVIDSNC